MDIDIDLADRDQLLELIDHRKAVLTNGRTHNTGVYITEIPHDPISKKATIDYMQATKRGYFKIDLLNVSIYDNIKDSAHLIKLMNTEPRWDLLLHKEFVDQVFHLAGHHKLLRKMQPQSIKQLAALLCMIRPGKKHLIGKPWEEVYQTVWEPEESNEYYYKHSHSVSYAVAVVVHMNSIAEQQGLL